MDLPTQMLTACWSQRRPLIAMLTIVTFTVVGCTRTLEIVTEPTYDLSASNLSCSVDTLPAATIEDICNAEDSSDLLVATVTVTLVEEGGTPSEDRQVGVEFVTDGDPIEAVCNFLTDSNGQATCCGPIYTGTPSDQDVVFSLTTPDITITDVTCNPTD